MGFFKTRILWVRGHTKDWGNELADKHAGEGADVEDENHVYTARPSDWDLSEFQGDFPQHVAGSQKMAQRIFDGANCNTGPQPATTGVPGVGAWGLQWFH